MLIKVTSDIYKLYEENHKVALFRKKMSTKEIQATFLSRKGTDSMNLILNLSAFPAGIMNWHTLSGSNKKLTAVRGEGVGQRGEKKVKG